MKRVWMALLLAACSRQASPTEPAAEPAPVPIPKPAPVESSAPVAPLAETQSTAPDEPLATAAGDGGTCRVEVVRLLSADVFSGPGVDSPARQKTIESLSPATQARWRGRDHSMRHVSCLFSVRVDGTRYRYRHLAKQGLASQNLKPELCSEPETSAEAAQRIVEFTKQCTNLSAGEYWGYRLEPSE